MCTPGGAEGAEDRGAASSNAGVGDTARGEGGAKAAAASVEPVTQEEVDAVFRLLAAAHRKLNKVSEAES